ncbi:1,4-beta-xylanase [Paenibacillus sp. LHD-38]|uniref:glycoside hydrolase family 113 n=1 Tax=Paenibacillus sp. LHD-38 TaxID=3072143 RepID=UPI0028106ABD|nr:1,4-beta-xylanase [Paenibacillus sp. LHD-38]MDQ8732952.1 1,4-beta-xylanase [Paenibacillus sp. LHD-38]
MTSKTAYIGGMTWGWTGIRGTWSGEQADRSMELMAERLNVNWTAIALGALQDHAHATEIKFREEPTVTDEEVRYAIRKAKELDLNVCLKPVVNCADGTWRAHINFFDLDVPCEPKWSDWFASYTEFILHYARIAEETGCEMYCIGCEMVQTDRRESEWRQLIAEVRKVYSGIVTYNCDKYQEGQIKWWDAVDVISSSGYYPIDSWEEQLDRIEKVITEYDKPFFFMEAGCPSREGSQHIPNDWGLPGAPSEEVQRLFYETMFAHSDKRDWVGGFMLWDWPSRLYEESEAAANDDYCMYGKQAEQTVRSYYGAKISKKAVGGSVK